MAWVAFILASSAAQRLTQQIRVEGMEGVNHQQIYGSRGAEEQRRRGAEEQRREDPFSLPAGDTVQTWWPVAVG